MPDQQLRLTPRDNVSLERTAREARVEIGPSVSAPGVLQKISQVATLRIPQMADASGGAFVYNGVVGLPVHPPCFESGGG